MRASRRTTAFLKKRWGLNNMGLKIEVGKFYKTRDGSKVRIYATDGSSRHPIHGAIQYEDGWHQRGWSLSGKFLNFPGENQEDLIAEWSEPKPKRLGWVNKVNGLLCVRPNGERPRCYGTANVDDDWERYPKLDEE